MSQDLASKLAEITSLTVDERIQLVEAIWDRIAAEPDEVKLTESQRLELARRRAAYAAAPQNVVFWDEVKAQALARARK